jgi:hypothetical protein
MWPKGKRRHPTDADVKQIMAELARYIESNRQAGTSKRKMAQSLGVCDRTLRRWLDGEDWPPSEMLAYIAGFVTPHPLDADEPYDGKTQAAMRAAQARQARRNKALDSIADSATPADMADRRYHGSQDD